MNRIKLKSFLHTANVALLLSVAIAGTAQDKLLAFPGAEGGGCYVTGGISRYDARRRCEKSRVASLCGRPKRPPYDCVRCGRNH